MNKKKFFHSNYENFILVDGEYDIDYRNRFDKFLIEVIEELFEIVIGDNLESLLYAENTLLKSIERRNLIIFSVNIKLNNIIYRFTCIFIETIFLIEKI